MSQLLSYGDGSSIRLHVAPEALLADCTSGRGEPLDDPAAAVAAILDNPLDFPPLARSTVPGDRIVLALDRGVPQTDAVVAGVVHTLLEGNSEPGDITILRASNPEAPVDTSPTALLADNVRDAIEVITHDPMDSSRMAYLAASKEGKPVYINRLLCDADVVLPISGARLEASLGYAGVHGGLFPTFSDEETLQRFRAPGTADWQVQQRRRRDEADEAAWLLGVQFTLQVVPGPRNRILHVLAGDANRVLIEERRLCEAAWLYETPRRASLVVAAIDGGSEQQTWENFARALFAATRAIADQGTIVLCTELNCCPGPALQKLTAPGSHETIARELRRERSDDALSASLLAEARERAHIYLLSGLEADVVEDLGLGFVADAEEIDRLSQQHESCILLSNAQHAVITAGDDEATA